MTSGQRNLPFLAAERQTLASARVCYVLSMHAEAEEELIANVAARIKHLRYAGGITQSEMAERLGTSLRNYQRIEEGLANLSLRSLARVAAALGVTPATLLTGGGV
jgi:DNA-binding XRE family transcriptional regulator